jgi:hypothetical protein
MAPSYGVNRKRVNYRYNRQLSVISLIKCRSLTGFAKVLVTTIFKFGKQVMARRTKRLIHC